MNSSWDKSREGQGEGLHWGDGKTLGDKGKMKLLRRPELTKRLVLVPLAHILIRTPWCLTSDRSLLSLFPSL